MHGYEFHELHEGMTAVYGRTVTDADIVAFAGVSGDTNPAHLNDEFQATSQFKTRIAHGMLSASYISTVLGTRLPGPGCIYLNQTLNFRAPVRIGDTVTATVTVRALKPKNSIVILETICRVRDAVVIDGEATVMVPARP